MSYQSHELSLPDGFSAAGTNSVLEIDEDCSVAGAPKMIPPSRSDPIGGGGALDIW